MDHIKELKEFVINNFMFGQGDSLENDTDFFDKGIIDSTGTLELVKENLSSLTKVDEYIKKKLASKSAIH